MKKIFGLLVALLVGVGTLRASEMTIDLSTAYAYASDNMSSAVPVYQSNVLTVNFSVSQNWEAVGVEFDLPFIMGITGIDFDYKGQGEDDYSFISYLQDSEGTRWTNLDDFLCLCQANWYSKEGFLPSATLWDEANYTFGDKPFVKIGFIVNPSVAEVGTFFLRNVKIHYEENVVYNWKNGIGTTIMSGTTSQSKIKVNGSSIDCIYLQSAFRTNSNPIENFIEISPSSGVFQAGDIVKVEFCVNNSDQQKYAFLGIFDTHNCELISDSTNNTYDVNIEPTKLQYTLTAASSFLRLGRSKGNTKVGVTKIEVIRGTQNIDQPTQYWYWRGYVDGADTENEYINNVFQNGISHIAVQNDAYLYVLYQEQGFAGMQYMSEWYVDGPTHATMTINGIEKLHIPAGTWTLYLYDNGDGTVELAYQPIAGKTLVNEELIEQYNVTANAYPSDAGRVSIVYAADYSDADLIAFPYSGYQFDHWNDGSTQNPRTVVLTQDTTFIAYFVEETTTPTYTVTANASPSYAGTVDVTYSADHTQATMTATANYGYRFLSWNDGNTTNPRTLNVTRDVTYTAYFEQYNTMLEIDNCDWYWKGWNGESEIEVPTEANLFQNGISQISVQSAAYLYLLRCAPGERVGVDYIPHEYSENTHVTMYNVNSIGYGGNKLYIPAGVWTLYLYNNGDGTVELSREPIPGKTLVGGGITPYFEISTNVYPANTGTVEVVYSDDHSMATMTAIGNTGYHFKRWNDGNLDNPRYVELTQDTTFTALFELDVLEVTYIGMDGRVLGVESVQYGSQARQRGVDTDEFGYTLVGWSEDLSYVTTDMTVTAIYTRDAVNGFYYIYDKENRTAVLDREGNSYANIRTLNVPNNFIYRGIKFAVVAVGANAFENCDRLTDVVLPGNVENVEEYAFSGCSDMIHLTMSANLRSIADYAFNGCKRLEDITVYAQRVPDLTATSFNAIGNKKYVNVYVPDNRVNNYKRDEYWSEFNIVVKSADAVEGEVSDVTVEPEETTAQFTWPTDNSAGSYTIEITKDGIVFCTLIFNANGQLTGIAFAPSRNGNEAPMATLLANGGMQFTVTGLDAGTSYAYTVTTKDTQERVIATFEGSFETSGSMEDGIMDVQSGAAPKKVLHNGQIYILRGEKVYTLQGVEVK